ncbi:low temperature requirement protein A [Nocardia spumae]|uniref:low temperature requirement protein A n=1 Tax=Nocardia spumae TaxID=2887190 RepID=UPI001D154AB0|nr:low temperature requirement protein A [Nocardia spumae]
MTTDTPTGAPHDRHATWTALFVDLVAVAGIGQLTHVLHHGSAPADLGLYLVLYLAFRMVWATVTRSSDIAHEATRTPLTVAAMLGLGVMAAAVPATALAPAVRRSRPAYRRGLAGGGHRGPDSVGPGPGVGRRASKTRRCAAAASPRQASGRAAPAVPR